MTAVAPSITAGKGGANERRVFGRDASPDLAIQRCAGPCIVRADKRTTLTFFSSLSLAVISKAPYFAGAEDMGARSGGESARYSVDLFNGSLLYGGNVFFLQRVLQLQSRHFSESDQVMAARCWEADPEIKTGRWNAVETLASVWP